MSVLVVDASVVIKWFVPETGSDAARRLLQSSNEYVAPGLIFAELGSVIWKKVQRGELTPAAGRTLAGDIGDIAVSTIPMRELLSDSVILAIATGVTVYDAMYVALALRLDTVLVTADAALARRFVSRPEVASHVQVLS